MLKYCPLWTNIWNKNPDVIKIATGRKLVYVVFWDCAWNEDDCNFVFGREWNRGMGIRLEKKKMWRKGKRGFEFELTLSRQLKEFRSKIKLGFK